MIKIEKKLNETKKDKGEKMKKIIEKMFGKIGIGYQMDWNITRFYVAHQMGHIIVGTPVGFFSKF